MRKVEKVVGRAIVIARDNIDTDQIIPARYLKVTQRAGLGDALFADWRYDKDLKPRADFPLNDPRSKGAQVLVAGANFGCGSSREHAVWAIQDFGFEAVIAPSFADIFYGNSMKNGLLPVILDEEVKHRLMQGLDDIALTLQNAEAIDAFEASGRANLGPVTTGL